MSPQANYVIGTDVGAHVASYGYLEHFRAGDFTQWVEHDRWGHRGSEWGHGHGRNRWRLGILLVGLLFAGGRRTVTSWLRAAGIDEGWASYYYFLSSVGRKSEAVAERLFVLLLRHLPLPERLQVNIDDTPTKRYGPEVEGADIHHNPTPGPADAKFLYGHVWVAMAME